MMFTNEQINEILAMCSRATPGPWDFPQYGFSIDCDDHGLFHAFGSGEQVEHDMQFVCQARTLLPQLAADYRKAMEERRWIPVEERLPEEPFGCLLTVEEDDYWGEPHKVLLPYFAGYDGIRWNDGDGQTVPFEVTHWMPLPIAPGLERGGE